MATLGTKREREEATVGPIHELLLELQKYTLDAHEKLCMMRGKAHVIIDKMKSMTYNRIAEHDNRLEIASDLGKTVLAGVTAAVNAVYKGVSVKEVSAIARTTLSAMTAFMHAVESLIRDVEYESEDEDNDVVEFYDFVLDDTRGIVEDVAYALITAGDLVIEARKASQSAKKMARRVVATPDNC